MKAIPFLSLLLLLVGNLFPGSYRNTRESTQDEQHYLFRLQNNSCIDIVSYQATGDWIQPTMYPDTLLPVSSYSDEGLTMFECVDVVQAGDDCGIFPYHKPTVSKKEFNLHFKSGIYSIFIIDAQTAFHEKSWEQIQEDYDILVRYDLTFDDIRKLGKVIPFPPTEEMKGMKMFPPYDDVVEKCRIFAEMSR